MLQQILNDMHIDSDLLAELDNEQKQILFCKMREEQVRRWKYYQEELEKEAAEKPKLPPKSGAKKVQFLLGKDGNPWTWVMGDHKDDKTIEEILEEEARKKAQLQAEKEAEEIRKSLEAKIVVDTSNTETDAKQKTPPFPTKFVHFNVRDVRTELNSGKPIWLEKNQQELKVQRANEIYANIRETQRKADELAELVRKEQEELWKEREKKAKEAERQIREIARQAREEHKKVNCVKSSMPTNHVKLISLNHELQESNIQPKHKRTGAFALNRNKLRPNKPPSKEAILDWYQTEELPNGSGLDPSTQKIAPWFHGIISRSEAEQLLDSKTEGTFLVRLSERIWGYAISYRGRQRCKHFLIEAAASRYQFFGSGHLVHNSLFELVTHHQKRPITNAGQEYLSYPCSSYERHSYKEICKIIEHQNIQLICT